MSLSADNLRPECKYYLLMCDTHCFLLFFRNKSPSWPELSYYKAAISHWPEIWHDRCIRCCLGTRHWFSWSPYFFNFCYVKGTNWQFLKLTIFTLNVMISMQALYRSPKTCLHQWSRTPAERLAFCIWIYYRERKEFDLNWCEGAAKIILKVFLSSPHMISVAVIKGILINPLHPNINKHILHTMYSHYIS